MHLQKVRMSQPVHLSPKSPEIKDKVSRREAFQLSLVGNNSPPISPVRKLAMSDGDENTPPPSPNVRKTLAMGGEKNTPPPSPSPNGMAAAEPASPKEITMISEGSGSFSPVRVVQNKDGKMEVIKSFYVAGPNASKKRKVMSGLQTNCPAHIMTWYDWEKNRDANAYKGPASDYFVETQIVQTITNGGADGLWIFKITMEYVTPVRDVISKNPGLRDEIARMYMHTLSRVNKALVDNVLEDPHPGNCGLRFHPDGTYELVFFDLQFSPIDKGIVIPGGYMLGDNMPNEMSKHDRKVIMRQRALLLMVESIRHYDPSSKDNTVHLQEIACKCGIDQMNLEQVNHALDAFLV
jgi:hypothetical protein